MIFPSSEALHTLTDFSIGEVQDHQHRKNLKYIRLTCHLMQELAMEMHLSLLITSLKLSQLLTRMHGIFGFYYLFYSSGIFPKSKFVGETTKSRDFVRFDNVEKTGSWKPIQVIGNEITEAFLDSANGSQRHFRYNS